MLVIGDAALKELKPDHNVKTIEIIGELDQQALIANTLNAPVIYSTLNRYSKEYNLKNNKKLLIYNCNELASLDKLTTTTFSKKPSFVFASPSLLFMIESIKVTERFYDVGNWETAVKSYNYLLKKYIVPAMEQYPNIVKRLDLNAVPLYSFVTNSNLIHDTYYDFKEYKTYKEEDLHNIFMSHIRKNFTYVSYSNNKSELFTGIWKVYTLEDKIATVLERAYVIAINEFVIPFWLKNRAMPINIDYMFKNALMIIVSTTTSEWFADFIIRYYNTILTKYNDEYVNIFANAVKFNEIHEVEE